MTNNVLPYVSVIIFFFVTDIDATLTQVEVTQPKEPTTVSSIDTSAEIRESSQQNFSSESIESRESIMKIAKLKPPKPLESASRALVATKLNNNTNVINNKPVQKSSSFKYPENVSRNENDAKSRAHVRYDEVTGELIDGDHPCHRECREGEEPMICYYHFVLEWYQTMSKACYDCPFNITDCFRPDCIPADGMNRPLNVINRKMPGPSIEVSRVFLKTLLTFSEIM